MTSKHREDRQGAAGIDPPEIFISYARSTVQEAREIAEALRARGYGVWRDDELPVHRPYAEVIEERLRDAKAVVVLWSAEAVRSQWVRAEAEVAREAGTLVQLSLDGVAPPLPFNQIQCADLKEWRVGSRLPGWTKVLTSIDELIGSAHDREPHEVSTQAELPSQPSIAVLPFANLSGDPDQGYFADGMVVEIVTALSRLPSLFVIDSGSSLTYRGSAVSRGQIARDLGVRYLLDGTVRRSGDRVRIAVELVDGLAGARVWTERFEGTLEDVFALQDTVANAVAAQISPAIEAAEVRRARSRPPADLGAYDLYLRARQSERTWTKEGLRQAIDLLEQAIARDPDYALALAYLACCHGNAAIKWGDDPQMSRSLALDFGRRAIHSAPDDPEVLSYVALSIALAHGDLALANAMIERSLTRNPGSASAWAHSGWIKLFGGQAETALTHFETARRLDPRSPMRSNILSGIGDCHLFLGRHDQAVALLKEAAELEPPDRPGPRAALVAALALAGRVPEAKALMAKIAPDDVTSGLQHFQDDSYRALPISGLALAGAELKP